MHMREFEEITAKFWRDYLSHVASEQRAGRLRVSEYGSTLSYPHMLLLTETTDFFLAELIGAKSRFGGLTVKKHKIPSIDSYLGQPSEGRAMVEVEVYGVSLVNLYFASTTSRTALTDRFPRLGELWETGLAYPIDKFSRSLNVDPRKAKQLAISNCLLVNDSDGVVRTHSIVDLQITSKLETGQAHREFIAQRFPHPRLGGVTLSDQADGPALRTASSFSSMYQMQGLRETTIGEYLRDSEDILRTALGARAIQYEVQLPWIDGDAGDATAIRPDLFIERLDGYFDICDLKLPLLKKPRLTRGNRNRRRFVDSVEEGISQLAHYEEYFSTPKNAAYAFDHCGIKVSNPKKLLIVGNWENFDARKVAEASRKLRPVEVLNYDAISSLYLAGKGVRLRQSPYMT